MTAFTIGSRVTSTRMKKRGRVVGEPTARPVSRDRGLQPVERVCVVWDGSPRKSWVDAETVALDSDCADPSAADLRQLACEMTSPSEVGYATEHLAYVTVEKLNDWSTRLTRIADYLDGKQSDPQEEPNQGIDNYRQCIITINESLNLLIRVHSGGSVDVQAMASNGVFVTDSEPMTTLTEEEASDLIWTATITPTLSPSCVPATGEVVGAEGGTG